MTFLLKLLLFIVLLLILYFVCLKPLLGMMAEKPKTPPKSQPDDLGDEDLRLPPKRLTDQERISRLAESDPERAKELVRQWLRDEEGK